MKAVILSTSILALVGCSSAFEYKYRDIHGVRGETTWYISYKGAYCGLVSFVLKPGLSPQEETRTREELSAWWQVPYDHPHTFTTDEVVTLLAALAKQERRAVIGSKHLEDLAPHIVRAFASATPQETVLISAWETPVPTGIAAAVKGDVVQFWIEMKPQGRALPVQKIKVPWRGHATAHPSRDSDRSESEAGFCSQCGGPLTRDDAFCSRCGARRP